MTPFAPQDQSGARWEQVKNRDTAAENAFVYAVSTTRIYCRPGCPSRLPRRENVTFFASSEEAERAGFRPCQRCQPNNVSLAARRADAVAKACAEIEAADGRPDFDAMAREAGMSRHHFHRIFKELAGLTPGAYLAAVRKQRALAELGDGASVTEAVYAAGYSSASRFYETCARGLGVNPSSFAKGGAGEVIAFAVAACSLGCICVAATEKGVCSIALGDAPEPLIQSLAARFPKADIRGGDADLARLVAQVVAFVEAPQRPFELPLHIRGTAFQHKVWRILQEIPLGETRTYAEVAAKAECPRAVRAVANAIAQNPLAVVVPCHRVVRTGGALSGYRWGPERKAALLKREGAL
jgi:AraC family transcriptional regulator, regulatory protein of adaptative response / methylated-DNA-[protein]-cysteine methyltransferase